MNQHRILVIFVALAACLLYGGYRAWITLKEVNEPNPATYPASRARAALKGAGINCGVRQVLYVNRDVNARIVLASNVSLNVRFFADASRKQGKYSYLPGTGFYGYVLVSRAKSGQWLVAALSATTLGELVQFEKRFDEIYRTIAAQE